MEKITGTEKRTKEKMQEFLKGWPWASCYELAHHFGWDGKTYIYLNTETFNILVPMDKEVLNLLGECHSAVKVTRDFMRAFLTADGFMWKQPKDAWVINKRGRKVGIDGKMVGVNFNQFVT